MTQNRSVPAPSAPRRPRSGDEAASPRRAVPAAECNSAATPGTALPESPAPSEPRGAGPGPVPFTANAQPDRVRPGGLVLTDACRPEIRRALQARPRILLACRASAPSDPRAMELAVASVLAGAEALQRREGVRVRHLLRPHETLPGVWWFGNCRPAPPGLTKLKLRAADHPGSRTALVLDSPAARPPEALIVGGPPAPRTPDGQPADQVTLVRWLGAHLYTDGWDARACAAYLAAHGWAPPALRARRPLTVVDGVVREAPAVRLRSGAAGRGAGRDALRAFLANLDFYETGDLVVHPPDGGEPVRMSGVLPLDGQPWITSAQGARIRAYRARRLAPPRRWAPAGAGETSGPRAARPSSGSDADGQPAERVGRHAARRPPAPPR